MPKQHSWCCESLFTFLLKLSHSEPFLVWIEGILSSTPSVSTHILSMSWISSLKSLASVAGPTGLLLKASTFVCLSPHQCNILKLKSCSISIHLPLMPCAYDIVANQSSGLWYVLRMKWFLCSYYLKCIIPHISAYHSPSMGWNFLCVVVRLLLAYTLPFQVCLLLVTRWFQHLSMTSQHQGKIVFWN